MRKIIVLIVMLLCLTSCTKTKEKIVSQGGNTIHIVDEKDTASIFHFAYPTHYVDNNFPFKIFDLNLADKPKESLSIKVTVGDSNKKTINKDTFDISKKILSQQNRIILGKDEETCKKGMFYIAVATNTNTEEHYIDLNKTLPNLDFKTLMIKGKSMNSNNVNNQYQTISSYNLLERKDDHSDYELTYTLDIAIKMLGVNENE